MNGRWRWYSIAHWICCGVAFFRNYYNHSLHLIPPCYMVKMQGTQYLSVMEHTQ
uniref:Uncharacterized protein n=1 Tax=Podoviridae sp. ct9A73 TaxID=2825225 RepID=A0A8S5UJZ2_9CAUD|nr:MAG TPA: hypothetical protein [Podoviridae sp. ct9A73]